MASVRRLRDFASRLTKAPGDSQVTDQLDEHAQLRSLGEQVRMLCSERLQDAVQPTVRHAYAVRRVAEGRVDKRAAESPGVSPDERLVQAIAEVSRAVREQLRVQDSEEVTIELS